jgi:hypothetical protein
MQRPLGAGILSLPAAFAGPARSHRKKVLSMNRRPHFKAILFLLAVAVGALAFAGAAAADPSTTAVPTGWTWDDGALVSSDGAVPAQTGWTWDGADIESPRGWTWDDSGAVTGWTWDDGATSQSP